MLMRLKVVTALAAVVLAHCGCGDSPTPPAADIIPPGSVTDLAAGLPTDGSITLTWTAPGDDGASGTAVEYDIRLSSTAIADTGWALATLVTGEPAPQAAGASEVFVASGLSPESTYCFALKTRDEVLDQWSGLSNVTCARTAALPDLIPPAGVTDLRVESATDSSVTLVWTAPGDDGAAGTAAEYDVRCSVSGISEATWAEAIAVPREPTPRAAGGTETFTLAGLMADTTYWVALKTRDEVADQWSDLSNVAIARTAPSPDLIPPAAVADLTAWSTSDSSITLTWTAPGDDGTRGTATEYDIRYLAMSVTGSNWDFAVRAVSEPAPGAAGAAETFAVTGLTCRRRYYFALKTRDEGVDRWSALSNVPDEKTWLCTCGHQVLSNPGAEEPLYYGLIPEWEGPGWYQSPDWTVRSSSPPPPSGGGSFYFSPETSLAGVPELVQRVFITPRPDSAYSWRALIWTAAGGRYSAEVLIYVRDVVNNVRQTARWSGIITGGEWESSTGKLTVVADATSIEIHLIAHGRAVYFDTLFLGSDCPGAGP